MTDLARGTSGRNQPPSDDGDTARRQAPSAVWWLIGLSLAVIAACLVVRVGEGPAGPAFAQSVGTAGAQGVFAFTGHLTKDAYGVFMVDVDAGTIWCYRFQPGKNVLKLVAARDWRYDRYLENYSTDPPPGFIKGLLEEQRAAALRGTSP